MASTLDSAELNAWFKKHGKHTFDLWNTGAQQARIPDWWQQLPSDDARVTPIAQLNPIKENANFVLDTAQSEFLYSESSSILVERTRALRISPKKGLSIYKLDAPEREISCLDFEARIVPAGRPDDCLEHTSSDIRHPASTVSRWLKKIPESTEQHSSLMWPLAAGCAKQNTLTTTEAIEAYQAEPESVITEHHFHQRQERLDLFDTRERFLQETVLKKLYLERYPGADKPRTISKTKNGYNPHEEALMTRNREQVNTPENLEPCETQIQGRGERKRLRSRGEWRDMDRQRRRHRQRQKQERVTGAQWVALGEDRRRT